ncbi:MAG: hypothetical protein KAT68_17315 [Bacteroidales bacterium]|nr:hypothetical protein [Bacteroidales bacterium]
MNTILIIGISFGVLSVLGMLRRTVISNRSQWEGVYIEWKCWNICIPAFLIVALVLIILGLIGIK